MSKSSTAALDSGASHTRLVEGIVAGDRQAEQEFIREFAFGVRVMVRRHCRPGDPIVDDLVQEVLSGVLDRLREGAIREAATLPGYVRATVIHITSAEYRRRRPAEPLSDDLIADDDPAAQADTGQLSSRVHELLADLPVMRDREILRRFYIEEEDKASICLGLEIESEHFHRVVFRARERFRTIVEKAGLGEER